LAVGHTAVRHKLPLLCIFSLNGGWTADPEGNKPGRDLGYTRYDIMAQGLGCYGEHVEQPEDIRPALERAKEGRRRHGRARQCHLTAAQLVEVRMRKISLSSW
jgi:thiamine pyrophosphate-dependent acetolactate synthase large subunit-like protein